MSKLFSSLQVGQLNISHRIVLAPLTRYRNDPETGAPGDLNAEYYSQRASREGTLLVTEACYGFPEAGGNGPSAPGLYTKEQINGWKRVVEAVHSKKSYIFAQLWGIGRVATKPDSITNLETGEKFDLISSSDGEYNGHKVRGLTINEIHSYIQKYVQAAKNFIYEAHGDGVEVHSAHGYLLNQFISNKINFRTDEYGGYAEGRCRFTLEVLQAITEEVGQERVAIRLSPFADIFGSKMDMPDIIETFTYLVKEINKRFPNLAYIHFVEPRVAAGFDQEVKEHETLDIFQDIWGSKPLIRAGGYTSDNAKKFNFDKYPNTMLAFGRYFISNPDLPDRIENEIPLNMYNRDTFYTPGPVGYIDQPFARKE